MTTERAPEAQRHSFVPQPTGFRRLTPGLLRVDRTAEGFTGLPEGVTVPGQLLAAFKAAAPRLGLSARLVHAIDWLFRFTQPQDWGRGGRPIVWPSAAMQEEALGLSSSQVKAINRQLIEAGLIAMKDSPNGKRYGKRDRQGQIVEAYGFDLAPIAARHAEFMRLAEEARTEREEMRKLRRRATIARNGITQILETVADYGFEGEEWALLARESQSLARALRRVEMPDEMTVGVQSLERRQRAARERLENLLATLAPDVSEAVDSDPKQPKNRPHHYTYKPSPNPEQDTVIASEGSSRVGGTDVSDPETPEPPQGSQEKRTERAARDDRGTVLRLNTDELVRLAPRLRPYLRSSAPTWREIVDAADWLRHDLGVSKSLWGEACLAMGREQAAIALAIVSAKPAEYFRTTPGGYFFGMVAKAKAGELHLIRTIWALRDGADPERRRKPGRAEGRFAQSLS
ncbi:MAG: plasmid replication protein RepC [Acetobacteraceae bacterium]